MFNIQVPSTITHTLAVFYGLGFWDSNNKSVFFSNALKLFHFTYYVSFGTSIAVGALISNNPDDFTFLSALFIIVVVHFVRMLYLFGKRTEIIDLIYRIGTHSTNERSELTQVKRKLEIFTKFAKTFYSACYVNVFLALISPIFSSEELLINIAFPWKSLRAVFWISHAFIVLGCVLSLTVYILTLIVWYLMLNAAIKYELLGTQMRNMGVVYTADTSNVKLKLSTKAKQNLFLSDLIKVIKAHRKIIE